MLTRTLRTSLLVGLFVSLSACDAQPPAGVDPLCEAAAEHVAACTGEAAAPLLSCDVRAAEAVLEETCESLTDETKADIFGNLFCRLGYLYRCAAPRCDELAESVTPASCEDYIAADGCASCEFYRCRDALRPEPCGSEGYYLGFVGRYCDLFSLTTAPRLSPQGQRWISDVRTCLQESMLDVGPEVACDEVRRLGYERHPACYIETGFCELPLTDLLAIFHTVDPADLGTQPIETAFGCVRRWFSPETGELTDEGEGELDRELAD